MALKDKNRRAAEERAANPQSNLEFKQYEDGTYKYFCEALPGTPLADSEWRISRMHIVDVHVEWCEGGTAFKFPATNLSIVANLFS